MSFFVGHMPLDLPNRPVSIMTSPWWAFGTVVVIILSVHPSHWTGGHGNDPKDNRLHLRLTAIPLQTHSLGVLMTGYLPSVLQCKLSYRPPVSP